MYGACGEARGPWAGRGEAAWPAPAPPPALCPLAGPVWRSPERPPSLQPSAGGRVWACEPACLDPPHKQARPAPSARAQPTRDTPVCSSSPRPCRPGGFRVTQWARETGSVQCVPGWALGEGPSQEDAGEPQGWESPRGAGCPTGLHPPWEDGEGHSLAPLTLSHISCSAGPLLCHLAHLLPPEGSGPLWSCPERALPGLHFWDNSTLLGLASCQLPATLPDGLWLSGAGPQPVPSQHCGGCRKENSWAAPCPLRHPLCHGHP